MIHKVVQTEWFNHNRNPYGKPRYGVTRTLIRSEMLNFAYVVGYVKDGFDIVLTLENFLS